MEAGGSRLEEGIPMYAVPRTRLGKWSLALLLVVVLYPLYWSVFTLIPESLRALQIGLGLLIVLIGVGSVSLASVAVFRNKDRSVLLYAIGAITLLMIVAFTVGESLGGH